MAKMGIPSDKYQEDWKSMLRQEKDLFFTNFRCGIAARRQVTLEKLQVPGRKFAKNKFFPDAASTSSLLGK